MPKSSSVDVTLPLQRNWLKANRSLCKIKDTITTECNFSVVTYNILADFYTPDNYFPYCSKEHFKAVDRLPQLLRELDHHDADVICLQEVIND